MASHQVENQDEKLEFGTRAWPFYSTGLFLGFVGIVGSVLLGYFEADGFRRFYFSWLVGLMFFLAIGLGGLFFTLLQHLVRAGWSVTVRRLAETIAASNWILLVLALPIIVSVAMQKGDLYRWAQPMPADQAAHHADAPKHASADEEKSAHAEVVAKNQEHLNAKVIPPIDELTRSKRPWLNPGFFIGRVVFYFAFWSIVGLVYWRASVRQDETKDLELTRKREFASAPLMLLFALTLTFGAFDLMMSLDPHWFSTMYPVVYFSNCAIAIFATLVIISKTLQSKGFLTESISVEHYHDLGKFLFAFTFFYGYVAFSQYMLLWYANLPETTGWFARRGASSMLGTETTYTWLALVVLFGHILIPFAGLLSRHVKRNGFGLTFFAGWQLVMIYVDLYWLILPELEPNLKFHLLDLTCVIGIGGLWLATVVRTAAGHALRPTADPRLDEALAFHNI
jgi:hypothetical protein